MIVKKFVIGRKQFVKNKIFCDKEICDWYDTDWYYVFVVQLSVWSYRVDRKLAFPHWILVGSIIEPTDIELLYQFDSWHCSVSTHKIVVLHNWVFPVFTSHGFDLHNQYQVFVTISLLVSDRHPWKIPGLLFIRYHALLVFSFVRTILLVISLILCRTFRTFVIQVSRFISQDDKF